MKIQKCIWILNHHASINGHRHYELACQFAKHGYQVVVIASSFHHEEHRYAYVESCHIEKIQQGVFFVYLHTQPEYSNNGARRVLNMFSYCRMVRKYSSQIMLKYGTPNYVIGSSVHPLAWEAAYWISRRNNAKFICEVRDLWPLSLIEISGTSPYHPLVIFFDWIQKRAYQRAERIVTAMPYANKYICDDLGFPREKVFWMPNGIRVASDDSSVTLSEELNSFLTQHWCCIYTGSFVESECIDFMIDAFSNLRDDNIYFAIIGSGHEQERLAQRIIALGLTKVRIFPRIQKEQVAVALKKAKCCLAAVKNHSIYRFGLSMNKLNDYLYSGVPTIFACDVPNVVQDACGITLPYGNTTLFADKIRQLRSMSDLQYKAMGEQGKNEIIRHYDYRLIGDRYIAMMESL